MARDSEKRDSQDPRLREYFTETALDKLKAARSSQSIVIVQYPDDEGVRLNKGRAGAKLGPAKIISYLGRMVYRPNETPDIQCLKPSKFKGPLKRRHAIAEEQAHKILALGYRLVTLGGGHDYGYPDAAAYYEIVRGKILNIDAHLDVRPVVKDRMNSGTPFFRFLERFGGQDFIAWGIQRHCNALAHRRWAIDRGMKVFSEREPMPAISGPVGLSVCLDAFTGIRGVSAPAMAGLTTNEGLEAVRELSPQSQWIGIYECAPKYDPLNEDSARFGALLAYHFIHSPRASS